MAELRMLKVSLSDQNRQSDGRMITGTAHVGQFGGKLIETRLRWFADIYWKDYGEIVEEEKCKKQSCQERGKEEGR